MRKLVVAFAVLAASSAWAATVKSRDGVEIRYDVAGQGSPTLVFVHGWTCDRGFWKAQIAHFSKTNRVVAMDLGGFGESGAGRKDWTMAAFGADVAAVLEAADVTGGVLIGHSMGGPVIVEAWKLAPKRVAVLVPVDTFNDIAHRISAKDRARYLAPLKANFKTAAGDMVRSMMFHRDTRTALVDSIVSRMTAARPEVGVSAMRNLMEYDEAGALAAVAKVPARLINADLWPTNLEAARKKKPDLELSVMPRVGHFLMEEDPEEFNRLLGRAVRDLTDRGAK